jgi:integrase
MRRGAFPVPMSAAFLESKMRYLRPLLEIRAGSFPRGCRKREILNLRWLDVDFEHKCLRLPDSKTGAKVVYLNAPTLALLTELPRVKNNPYVFVGTREGAATKAIDKVWARVRTKAELTGVRIHDLRHSYASVGAVGGYSLPIIGALLGHKHAMTTARYAHLSADPLRAANEAVGGRIAAAMADSQPESPASIECIEHQHVITPCCVFLFRSKSADQ